MYVLSYAGMLPSWLAYRVLLAATFAAAFGRLGWPHGIAHNDVRRFLSLFKVRSHKRQRLLVATSFLHIDEAETAHGSERVRVASTAPEAAETGGFSGAGIVANGGGAHG